MGWWDRLKAELRAVLFPSAAPDLSALYGVPTVANEPITVERAVSLSAVWACVSLIAGAIAAMPLIVYRRTADDSRERFTDHPLFDVLRLRPNPVQSVVSFWESMVVALLLRGNSFAQITRDDFGRVRA